MAESDHDPANQRIVNAFGMHYADLMTALRPCFMKVAVDLRQVGFIHSDTVRAVYDIGIQEQVKIFKVVDAVETCITACNSLSKSLEILSLLEKHPPLNGVVDNIRKDAGLTSGTYNSNGEFHSHYQILC